MVEFLDGWVCEVLLIVLLVCGGRWMKLIDCCLELGGINLIVFFLETMWHRKAREKN